MKKILLSLTFLLLGMQAFAVITFDANKKYRIVCNNWNTGAMVLGSNHGSTALLYYDATATTDTEDAWWYIKQDGNGYTIQNAKSRDYIYYEGTRENGVAKGIRLTSTVTGDVARWTFGVLDNDIYIKNVAQSGEYINIRTDGTNLIGTYAETSSLTANELFAIYDSDGNRVTDDGAEGGNTDIVTPTEGQSGVTPEGEFWELTGMDRPFVLTTDTSDPVLYSIMNVRRGNYLYRSGWSILQTSSAATATKFYFVEGNNGYVNVYSQDGYYISTYSYGGWYGSSSSIINPEFDNGTTSTQDNLWHFSFYDNATYPGYSVERKTNVATSSATGGEKNYWNDYNGQSICFYTLDDGSTFRLSSSDERHLEYLLSNGISIPGYKAQKRWSEYVDSIRFEGKDLVWRKDTKTYMFNVRPKYRNEEAYVANIETKFKSFDGRTFELGIDGTLVGEDGTYDFENISCEKDYELQVWERVTNGSEPDSIVTTAKLNFTFLPIVEINMPSCNGTTYTQGDIRVNFFQAEGYDSTYVAKFKYRGATAQGFPKKSYAVKIYDKNGEKKDVEFLNYREDNNWILDAMAIDKACMRNRVATDLWNDFSVAPYHKTYEKKARTGTRGRFVEVFLNGSYNGIYCMTEKIDRKQLKLKKLSPKIATPNDTIHGVLYKSKQWTYEVFFGHDIDDTSYSFPSSKSVTAYNNDNKSEDWQGYQVKYPDWEEEPITWKPLYDKINFVAKYDEYGFANDFEKHFDYKTLRDYYLFLELLLATDNHGKNMYYYAYDINTTAGSKFGVAPWDLDGTWGIRWDGKTTASSSSYGGATQLLPTLDFPTFLDRYEHGQLSYFYLLQRNPYLGWEDALRSRYHELRPTFFKVENLQNRFSEYMEIFALSGADKREQERWSALHPNLQESVDYSIDWIKKRVAFLDEKYGYHEPDPSTGIQYVGEAKTRLGVTGSKGSMTFHAPEAQTIDIYNMAGQRVRRVHLPQGISTITGFMAGAYIAGGQKVIVR